LLREKKSLQKAEHLIRGRRYRRPVLGWIQRQRRLGLPAVIRDAGYVGEYDDADLDSVFQRSRADRVRPGPSARLPGDASSRWLTTRAHWFDTTG
jgi:hypothetical protein